MISIEWEKSEFFADTADEARGCLRDCVRIASYQRDQAIFQEGDAADDVYILKSGMVELTCAVPMHDDCTMRITRVKPGDVFAWSALAGSNRLTARASALEDSEAFLIPASRLREVMDRNPEFGYELMNRLARLIANRLRDTRTQLQWLNSF